MGVSTTTYQILNIVQRMNMLKIPIHAHGFTTSTYTPMECLNINFIGPFPDQGYILVIVDTFTRWVELYHTTDATALSAGECLLEHLGRFGAPHQLRSDNGPNFIAELIREYLLLVGVKHCLTLAYSKKRMLLWKDTKRNQSTFTCSDI